MSVVYNEPGGGVSNGSQDATVGENVSLHYSPSGITSNDSSLLIDYGEEETEYIFDRGDVRAIFLVLYTIVFCSCFFGNLMVILVVTLHWRMRSITNFCLANLAFADLCVGIFCVYQNIVTYLMDSWIFGEFMCKMYHFINSLSTTASVLILVVICIERYLAIVHPMTCKQMLTLSRLRITIVCVWILSAVISSPRFYYFSTISYPLHNGQYETLCLPNRTKYNSKLLDMVSMIVLFLIPLGIISVLYTVIGIVLWKTSNTKMSGASASVENSSSSGSCSHYKETENSIAQLVKLTLLPVNNIQQQQSQSRNRPTTLHGTFQSNNTSNTTGNQCNYYSGKTSVLRSSSLMCIKYGNHSKKSSQKLNEKYVQVLGQNREINYQLPTMMKESSSCPCHNSLNGSTDQEVINHFRQSPTIQNHSVETILSNRNHYHSIERKDAELGKVIKSPTSKCCGGGRLRCLNALRKQGLNFKRDKATALSSPLSPFPNKICTDGFDERRRAKTEPIVLVKFERKQKNNKKGRKSQCTILMNTKSLQSNPCQCDDNAISSCVPATFPDDIQYKFSCENVKAFRYKTPKFHSTSANLNHSTVNNLLSRRQPKKLKRLRVLKSSKYGSGALQSRRRVVKMLIFVVLAFAICHLPFHARKIWQYNSSNYEGGSVFSQVFTPFTFLIMYVNSGINPILYAFMSKKFRMSFRDLLCCKMRQSLRVSRNASVKSTHVVALSHVSC